MQPAPPSTQIASAKSRRPWKLLLLLPYFGLCLPHLYARATPVVWGFPFFYWYQFLWVILTSVILTIFYLRASTGTRRATP